MADRVRDAVQDGRDDRDGHHLSHAFRWLVVREWGKNFGSLRPYRHIAATRQVITVEIPGAVPGPILIQRQKFVQSQADAGGYTALDLARHQIGHQHVAALEDGVMREQVDTSIASS